MRMDSAPVIQARDCGESKSALHKVTGHLQKKNWDLRNGFQARARENDVPA